MKTIKFEVAILLEKSERLLISTGKERLCVAEWVNKDRRLTKPIGEVMNRINSYAWDTCLARTSRRHSTHAQTRVQRKHEITNCINQGKIELVF